MHDPISIDTASFEQMKQFYTKLVGLKSQPFGDGDSIMLSDTGFGISILLSSVSSANEARVDGQLIFQSCDLIGLSEFLKRRGMNLEPRDDNGQISRVAFDPDGNVLRFVSKD